MHLEFQDRILEVTTIDVVSSYWTLGLLQSYVENITFNPNRGHDMRCREELRIRRPWALLQLTTRDVVWKGEEKAL